MKLRDLFRRKTPEPLYRWHVEAKLEERVMHAVQVERVGGCGHAAQRPGRAPHAGSAPEELKAMEQRQWASMQLGQPRRPKGP